MPSSEIDLFWRPPKFRSLPPPAGPGGKPRNEAYEALHAITDKRENRQQTLFHRITWWREWLIVRHGDGIEACWDAANEPSAALARQLGFQTPRVLADESIGRSSLRDSLLEGDGFELGVPMTGWSWKWRRAVGGER